MSKKRKQKQSTTIEDHRSLRYRNGEVKEDFFDEIDFEISSILLELSHPVVLFPSDSPYLHKWGRTKKRSSSGFLHPPEISPEPVIKSPPFTEVGEMGSTSSSSCLTGEAKKTNPQSIKKGLEEEFSKKNQSLKPKISYQPNSVFKIQEETGLSRVQVGLLAQPVIVKRKKEDQNLCHLQPLICVHCTANVRDVKTVSQQPRDNLERRDIDLNLPAAEEGNIIAAMVDYQRVTTTNVQAAAQARQRRLGLIRTKKLFNCRFISPYQLK